MQYCEFLTLVDDDATNDNQWRLLAASFTLRLLHSNGISTLPPSYNHSIILLPSALATIVPQLYNYLTWTAGIGNNSSTTTDASTASAPQLGKTSLPIYLLLLFWLLTLAASPAVPPALTLNWQPNTSKINYYFDAGIDGNNSSAMTAAPTASAPQLGKTSLQIIYYFDCWQFLFTLTHKSVVSRQRDLTTPLILASEWIATLMLGVQS